MTKGGPSLGRPSLSTSIRERLALPGPRGVSAIEVNERTMLTARLTPRSARDWPAFVTLGLIMLVAVTVVNAVIGLIQGNAVLDGDVRGNVLLPTILLETTW